jgi:outer membrane protein assembly factor BamB
MLKRVLVTGLALVSTAWAEDWPHWRGPGASGVSSETGLPDQWSATENVAWRAEFRGVGISSPIVAGGQVLVTSQVGGGESREGPRLMQSGDAADAGEIVLSEDFRGASTAFIVTAFDPESGESLWEYELAAEGTLQPVHEKHNLASPSPVSDGEQVYAWFGTGQLIALDLEGNRVWSRHMGAEYGTFDINWGHGSSPVVYEDSVILLAYHPSGAYLLALDRATGLDRWKTDGPEGATSYSTPFVVETDAGAEIIVNSSEGLSAHDARTGEFLWTVTESNRFPIPTGVESDGIIYTSRGYRSGPYMAIRPGGRGEVSETHVLWKVATGAPYVSSLVYYEGLIYMMGDVGVATVIDAATGERIWQERIGGVYTASPVAGDGKVYFLSESGETVVLGAGREPRVLARNDLGVRQLASPAISGGRLYIRSDSTLFAIEE